MSDSVVKLRIDSKEYDANIKRAGQALTDYFEKVREGGGTLMHLDEGVMDAVKAMGELGTQSNNTKGALRELTQATADMTVAYRSLTDEEKNSPLGAAMAESIQQMTERAGEMRDAMDDVQASIQNSASDTRTFDQIAGGMQAATAGFQTVTGAAKLMGIQMGDDVEIIAKLQAAMAVTNGFQTMQNMLQKQSALMQGVNALQKEFNILANANPYVLLATAAAAVVTAYFAWTSGARDAEKAQKALNNEIESTNIQLSQIDKDTDFSVGIAEASGKSWKAIHELRLEAARTKLQLADMNYDKLAESGVASAEQIKQAAEMQKKAWDDVMKVLNEGTIHDIKMRNAGGSGSSHKTSGTNNKNTVNDVFDADSILAYEKHIANLEDQYKRAGESLRDHLLPQIEAYKKKLADIKNGGEEIVPPQMAVGLSGFNEQTINAWVSMIKSDLASADIGSEVYNSLMDNLSDMSRLTTTVQDAVKLGLEIPKDVVQSMFETVFDQGNLPEDMYNDMIKKFIEDFKKQTGKDLSVGTNGSLSEAKDNGKASEKEDKTFQDFTKGLQSVTSGLSSVTTGLKSLGVEIPAELDSLMSTINAVGQIISGVQQIISVFQTSAIAANTAAVTANTIALGVNSGSNVAAGAGLAGAAAGAGIGAMGGGLIGAAIGAGVGFLAAKLFSDGGIVHAANGFVVPGNSLSGDNVPALLNSGEVVLNHSQVNNLASQLEGGGLQNLNLEARIEAEDIVLTMNNNSERWGGGEYVTSK